jgi:hypothetical protein
MRPTPVLKSVVAVVTSRQFQIRLLVFAGLLIGALGPPALHGALDQGDGVQTQGNITLQTDSGPNITVSGGREIDLSSPFVGPHTLDVNTTAGNVSFESPGRTHATLTAIGPPWTNLTRVGLVRPALGGPLTITTPAGDRVDISGTPSVGIGGGGFDDCTFNCTVSIGNINATDTEPDVVYNRTVGGGAQFTFYDLAPNTEMLLGSVGPNTALPKTTNNDGTVVFDVGGTGQPLYLQTQFGGPSISNPAPTTDDAIPSSASVTIDDPNLDTGSFVDVEFQVDGSTIDSQQIYTSGTVSASLPSSARTAGEHTVTVEATDAFGATDLETYTYSVPAGVQIRNETSPSQVITQAVNLTIFADDQVFNRSTTTGAFNLAELPTNQPLVIEATSPGFFDRTVYVPSVFEQQDIYLLNKTVGTIQSRFVLSDPTGQFDSQDILVIKKPIASGNETRFESIYGDAFGSEGVTVDLESNTRYNLVLRTREGIIQDVGPYRSDVGETVTVQPGSPGIDIAGAQTTWTTDASIIQNSTGAYKIEFGYNDTVGVTESVGVFVHERGDRSAQLGANRSYTAVSNVTGLYNLTEEQADKTWVDQYTINRDGERYTPTEEVATLQDLTSGLDPLWQSVIGIGILLLSAGLFSQLNAGVGGVVVSIEAGVLWWTGWLTGPTTGAGIVIALLVAVFAHLYQQR